MLKVKVTGAQLCDCTGAHQLLGPLAKQFSRMERVWADQGYSGDWEVWMKEHLGWRLEIVMRTSQKEHRNKIRAIAKERQKAGASVVEMWAGLPYGRGIEVLPRRVPSGQGW